MLAIVEAIPYVAFTGAGLLVAFVAGEALYKKFALNRFVRPALVPIAASRPAAAPVVTEQPHDVIAVAAESGSQEPVEVFDDSPSVRVAEVSIPGIVEEDSTRVALHASESTSQQVVLEPIEPAAPTFVPGSATERCDPVGDYGTSGREEALTVDEGMLCNEVVAIRRDPSVRVFDAVVAPSERKNTAA